MKVFIFILLSCVSFAVAERERRFLFNILNRCSTESDCGPNKCCLFNRRCFPKLFKYATCYLTGIHKCGCRDGLECRVTKEFNILGQRIQLRQCMPTGERNDVEKLTDDELSELVKGDREKRFLIDRCSSEADCGENRCCLFGKVCARKLPNGFTCFLTSKHKCGCQDGLECRVTATITIPIIGSKIPLRQCVPPEH